MPFSFLGQMKPTIEPLNVDKYGRNLRRGQKWKRQSKQTRATGQEKTDVQKKAGLSKGRQK